MLRICCSAQCFVKLAVHGVFLLLPILVATVQKNGFKQCCVRIMKTFAPVLPTKTPSRVLTNFCLQAAAQ
jgi:hypothetical protein